MGFSFLELSGHSADDPRAVAAGEDFDELADLIDHLVCIRKEGMLTQQDVADAMGTHQSVVSKLERIGGNPTIRTLQAYARAVGARITLGSAQVEDPRWTKVSDDRTDLVVEEAPLAVPGSVEPGMWNEEPLGVTA